MSFGLSSSLAFMADIVNELAQFDAEVYEESNGPANEHDEELERVKGDDQD